MQPSDLALLVMLDALLQTSSVTVAARRVGLSTPAMSHALARIRERFADPILVRSGRGMVLTPRAETLKARVHELVAEARKTLEPERPFVARELSRTFVVHATDYVLSVLGFVVDRILSQEAPLVCLRFVPNAPDDASVLRDGAADLAVGIYGELPPEMRSRQLLTDRFVLVLRKGHPALKKKITLEQYAAMSHIQVAPRGKAGGYVDNVLAEKGLTRRVVRAVPYFTTAMQWAAQTDHLLTISERIARKLAPQLDLEITSVPLELRPYALSLLWHPRFDADAGHRYLRDVFIRAAKEAAGDLHERPRVRLESADPTSGQVRRRKRKAV